MLSRINTKQNRQQGFTIVELMIATMIFSIVLLVCAMAIIHVGRMFYKGSITTRTQDVSRKAIEDVSNAIRFGIAENDPAVFYRTATQTFNLPLGVTATYHSHCLGTTRYTVINDRYMNPGGWSTVHAPYVLWRDRIETGGACPVLNLSDATARTDSINNRDGQELVGRNMRVPAFAITPPTVGGSTWGVNIRVSFGDSTDLFEDGVTASRCKGLEAGGQFCAVSAFSTTVIKRM